VWRRCNAEIDDFEGLGRGVPNDVVGVEIFVNNLVVMEPRKGTTQLDGDGEKVIERPGTSFGSEFAKREPTSVAKDDGGDGLFVPGECFADAFDG
jgi:hypothetical protein